MDNYKTRIYDEYWTAVIYVPDTVAKIIRTYFWRIHMSREDIISRKIEI